MTCLESQSWEEAELGFKSRRSDPRVPISKCNELLPPFHPLLSPDGSMMHAGCGTLHLPGSSPGSGSQVRWAQPGSVVVLAAPGHEPLSPGLP